MSDDKLHRIESKIDHITEKISSIDVTLAKQSVILDEHVKRSTQLENRMEPVEKHVNMINGAFKLIGLMATLAAIAECIILVSRK